MLRFVIYAVPLLFLLFALFALAGGVLGIEPGGEPLGGNPPDANPVGNASLLALILGENPRLVISTWFLEAFGLVALFLLAEGRCGLWWLDGLVTGWVAWIFRGPLLVITLVVAAGEPQDPWWRLAFGWWVLYSVCGLGLAVLARRLRWAGARASEVTGEEPASSEEENPVR